MSSNNNDNGAMLGMAFVIAGLAFIGMFVFALLAFIALVLSVLALMAWNNPLTIGQNTITPEEARTFIRRGIAGAVVLPVFVSFTSLLLDLRIDPDVWFYLVVGGYTAGSLGLGIIEAQEQEKAQAAAQYELLQRPQSMEIAPPARLAPPQQAAEAFRFATWDDEEERS